MSSSSLDESSLGCSERTEINEISDTIINNSNARDASSTSSFMEESECRCMADDSTNKESCDQSTFVQKQCVSKSDSLVTVDVPRSATNSVSGCKSRTRCALCNKKLGLAVFECECGDSFCSKHRRGVPPTIYRRRETVDCKKVSGHPCTIDWAAQQRELLSKQMSLSTSDKRRQHGMREAI